MAAVIALVGCDRSTRPDAQPAPVTQTGATLPRSGSPGGSGSTAGAQERAVVEAAYRRFWAVSWDVDKQPVPRWRVVLAGVSVDPELTRVYAGTKAQRQAGIRMFGHVRLGPPVLRLAVGRAEVFDCQDASQAGQADSRTGRPRTVGVARSPVEAVVLRGADGVWRVSDVRYVSGSC
jgi:hypothetical protein